MPWNPTNANDVELIVSQVERNENGTRTGATEIATTNRIVVDEFSIETSEDIQWPSGVGRREPRGSSQGNVNHSFSFTVQGEDARLFKSLASENGSSVELEIIARLDDFRDKLTGARADTRNLSGSDGDIIEYEVAGGAAHRDGGDNPSA